jgi:hypothetical protein
MLNSQLKQIIEERNTWSIDKFQHLRKAFNQKISIPPPVVFTFDIHAQRLEFQSFCVNPVELIQMGGP